MATRSLDNLGAQQRTVVEIVWELGEASVQDVRDRLNSQLAKPLAYTTVLSVLQKLERLGWLRHRQAGRSYLYSASQTRRQVDASTLKRFIDRTFSGDPMLMLERLVEDHALSRHDLDAIQRLLDRKHKEQ